MWPKGLNESTVILGWFLAATALFKAEASSAQSHKKKVQWSSVHRELSFQWHYQTPPKSGLFRANDGLGLDSSGILQNNGPLGVVVHIWDLGVHPLSFFVWNICLGCTGCCRPFFVKMFWSQQLVAYKINLLLDHEAACLMFICSLIPLSQQTHCIHRYRHTHPHSDVGGECCRWETTTNKQTNTKIVNGRPQVF